LARFSEAIGIVFPRLYVVDASPRGSDIDFIKSYIVVGEDAAAIIDPGPSNAAGIVAEEATRLISSGSRIYIVLTHIHIDHAGGTGPLIELLRSKSYSVEVWVHPRGARHLADPSKLWEASQKVLGKRATLFGAPAPVPQRYIHETSDGDELCLGETVLHIIHTPGHASHHQSIAIETARGTMVFTGDSAGIYDPLSRGLVPTTPPPFRLKPYLESLDKMRSLDPCCIAPTHLGPGPGSLLDEHREQILLWYEVVEKMRGEPLDKILEEILRKDKLASRLVKELGWSNDIRGAIIDSIKGLLNYFEQSNK